MIVVIMVKRIDGWMISKILVITMISLVYWNYVPVIPQEDVPVRINTSNLEREIIVNALNSVDSNISRYVTSVNVMDNLSKVCFGDNKPGYITAGCVDIKYNGSEIANASIYLISMEIYPKNKVCQFKNTMYHELGHVDEVYNGIIDDGEEYAINYAKNYTKEC